MIASLVAVVAAVGSEAPVLTFVEANGVVAIWDLSTTAALVIAQTAVVAAPVIGRGWEGL